MAKFRVVVRPSGLINGREWPEVGEVVELPEAAGAGMVKVGDLEAVKAAAPAKKAAEKVEKRPASKASVETRAKKD